MQSAPGGEGVGGGGGRRGREGLVDVIHTSGNVCMDTMAACCGQQGKLQGGSHCALGLLSFNINSSSAAVQEIYKTAHLLVSRYDSSSQAKFTVVCQVYGLFL